MRNIQALAEEKESQTTVLGSLKKGQKITLIQKL